MGNGLLSGRRARKTYRRAVPPASAAMEFREQLQDSLGDAYIIERELGGGGMSRVFLAEERDLGRNVVVKVLVVTIASSAALA